jgi:hypothetical protein
MSRIEAPVRFGPPTTASLKADITNQRTVVSRACADLESAVRKLATLVDEPGAQHPVLGYHAALVYPEAIDRDALAAIRDEALRDIRLRLDSLLALVTFTAKENTR